MTQPHGPDERSGNVGSPSPTNVAANSPRPTLRVSGLWTIATICLLFVLGACGDSGADRAEGAATGDETGESAEGESGDGDDTTEQATSADTAGQPAGELPEDAVANTIDDVVEATSDAQKECVDRLESSGVDLTRYNSIASANDVEAVRIALGYEQLNPIGVSYRTRLGQTYMRLYPASIRSIVRPHPDVRKPIRRLCQRPDYRTRHIMCCRIAESSLCSRERNRRDQEFDSLHFRLWPTRYPAAVFRNGSECTPAWSKLQRLRG